MFSFLAKKSEEVMKVYTNDLTDFTSALTKEAAPISGLLSGWFDPAKERRGSNGDKNEFVVTKNTFLEPISSEETKEATEECGMKEFEEWMTENPIENQTDKITQMIKNHQSIETLHKNNVPQNLEYSEFWSRYFYRREIFKIKKEKRETLRELVEEKEVGEDLSWDEDDDVDSPRSPQKGDVSTRQSPNEDNIMVEEFRKMLEVKDEEIKIFGERIKKLDEENMMLKKSKNVEEMVEKIEKKKDDEINALKEEHNSKIEKMNQESQVLQENKKKLKQNLHVIFKWIMQSNEDGKKLETFLSENHQDSVFADFEVFKKEEESKKVDDDYGDWE